MRRWVFALLLVVLPFQLVWGAAAPYCTHEASIDASAQAGRHFGHHEHRHQSGDEITPAWDEGSAGAYHADCGSCHLGCSAAPPIPCVTIGKLPHAAVATGLARKFASHIPAGPERPDRIELPAAARFGGGVEFPLLLS